MAAAVVAAACRYVPVGVKEWLVDAGVPAQRIVEMSWWQVRGAISVCCVFAQLAHIDCVGHAQEYGHSSAATVVCTPAQHWSSRVVVDRYVLVRFASTHDVLVVRSNKSLWSSFLVNVGGKSFFFAGDTGMCDVSSVVACSHGRCQRCLHVPGLQDDWGRVRAD